MCSLPDIQITSYFFNQELLERFNAGSASNTKVKFDRRRAALDSDDED